MKKRRIRLWLIACVAMIVLCLLLLSVALFVAWHIRQPCFRELRPKEIRPWFKLITQRELPEKTEGLRAILWFFRDREIFVAFQTDPQGCSYILDAFGGQDVQTGEFVKERDYVLPLRGFAHADAWQKRLGILLFDRRAVRAGSYLDSGGKPPIAYQVLIEKDQNKVYIYAYREGDRWLPFRVWLRQTIFCY